MKYYIARKSKYTGMVEIKMHKCSDNWCSKKYLDLHPERVWKFSESGARKIVKRMESFGWNFEYELIPADM